MKKTLKRGIVGLPCYRFGIPTRPGSVGSIKGVVCAFVFFGNIYIISIVCNMETDKT